MYNHALRAHAFNHGQTVQYTAHSRPPSGNLDLKGLSYEIDFENVDEN